MKIVKTILVILVAIVAFTATNASAGGSENLTVGRTYYISSVSQNEARTFSTITLWDSVSSSAITVTSSHDSITGALISAAQDTTATFQYRKNWMLQNVPVLITAGGARINL